MSDQKVDQLEAMRDFLITMRAVSLASDKIEMHDPFDQVDCDRFVRKYAEHLYDRYKQEKQK